MRAIAKTAVPTTITETRTAPTTDLSTPTKARGAFDQIDKGVARAALAREQGFLCAFCMRRVNPEALAEGEPTMKIAHRTPVAVDPARALTWKNLLGSCDGGQRSGGRRWSCDAAQGSTALSVDPTEASSCARLQYERRSDRQGLFLTSDDPALKGDVETTLALNSGDLPELREQAWKSFCALQQKHAPGKYGREARRDYLAVWLRQYAARLPEMLGVIEAQIR